jgi:hypothetical protein
LSRQVKDGKRTRRRCLTFFVLRKRTPGELADGERLPAKLHGLPTDVIAIERPRMVSQSLNPGEGIQLAAFDNPARAVDGTVAAVLQSDDGRRFLLGNNHVLAQCGRLPVDSPVEWVDPDEGFPTVVATTAASVPLLPPPARNPVDAALALITVPDRTALPISGDLQLASALPAVAAINRRVVKFGAASGKTRGTITSIHGQFPLGGPNESGLAGEVFAFDEVILVTPDPDFPGFCRQGDSGSLLIDEESRRAVGIVMGRSGALGLACLLQTALDRLSAIIGSPLRLLVP